ncbi:hypothetical protein JRQ81_002435 [Phrynocephalus forsythii]|uniref:DDE-1 domain-containing protein n=1 Tax=Phrynocephalus forsythii TaxID=171643 RepID=A0A9Q1AWP0_9SAUR|nr:hypothetical protein JRQ81_002435 [Phrynocephalus forsythii]
MTEEGYFPQQVFNCNEKHLFWKRMPKGTYITQEETRLPRYMPMKDRLTFLFCANTSGNLKIKPLLVYHSENPQAFKKHRLMDQQVISNFKKLYTRELFRQYFERTNGTTLTLHEYWRDHFDIVSCVQLIKIAWDEISQDNVNTAWHNLWPGCVVL